MSIPLATRFVRERLALLAQGAFFFLLILLPFQKKFKIFKTLASSWTASFHFPEAFQKNIYFFLTDLSLVIFAIILFSSGRLRALFTNSSRYLTLLFFVATLSLLSSSTCLLHYAKLFHFFLILLFFYALESGTIFAKIAEWFPKICKAVLAVSLFECVVGILQYVLQKEVGLRFLGEVGNNCWVPLFDGPLSFFAGAHQDAMRRASGTFPHPNVFGGFMVFAIGCSYFLFSHAKNRGEKVLVASGLFFQILTLCLTFSRAALIAWLFMTIIWFSFSFRMKLSWRPLAVGIAFCLAAFMLVLYPAMRARGGIVNYNKIVKDSDHERAQFQNIALEMIKEKPLLGIGFNQYVVRMQEFSPVKLKGDQFFPVHNIYLLIGAEMGVIGLILFLLFIGSLIWRGFKCEMNPVTASLLSLFIGLLFIGCCDFYLLGSQHGKLIFFMTAGLLSLSTSRGKDVAGR